MDFYLTKDKHVEMFLDGGAIMSTTNVEIRLEPAVKPVNGWATQYYCDLLATSLVENACDLQSTSLKGDEICRHLRLCLTLPTSREDQNGNIRIYSSGDVKGSGVKGGANIFQRLEDVHGNRKFKLNVKLAGFHYAGDVENKLDIVKNGVPGKVEFPPNMRGPWEGGLTFFGDLTVSVTLSDDVVGLLHLEDSFKSALSKNHKVALEEAICSDLVIVASNGTEVKCHKCYLAVSSDVFKAIFESQMMETITNSINMEDMSESGVRAFPAFIYHWDLTEASKDCDIAYELFYASHKYATRVLENAIGKLICAKTNECFSVDMTVRLLLFTKNVKYEKEETEGLFQKSLQILKWHNRASPMNLLNSTEY